MLADKEREGVDMKQAKYGAIAQKIAHIMDIPIADIKTAHLQQIIDDNKHLSYSTLQHIKSGLNGAFRAALKNDIVSKNYASLVILPPAEQSTIHKPFSEEEIYTLWQHTDIPLIKIILIYIYSGMRPIELRKLTLDNVFLQDRYAIGGVKTQAGRNRIIPIAECVYPLWSEIYAISRFQRSSLFIPPRYVPVRLDGPLVRLSKELGIAEHKPHDCRHIFITLCSRLEIAEHLVKAIVGHVQSDITNKVYVHRSIQQFVDTVNQLPHGDQLLKKKGCATVAQR